MPVIVIECPHVGVFQYSLLSLRAHRVSCDEYTSRFVSDIPFVGRCMPQPRNPRYSECLNVFHRKLVSCFSQSIDTNVRSDKPTAFVFSNRPHLRILER